MTAGEELIELLKAQVAELHDQASRDRDIAIEADAKRWAEVNRHEKTMASLRAAVNALEKSTASECIGNHLVFKCRCVRCRALNEIKAAHPDLKAKDQ